MRVLTVVSLGGLLGLWLLGCPSEELQDGDVAGDDDIAGVVVPGGGVVAAAVVVVVVAAGAENGFLAVAVDMEVN